MPQNENAIVNTEPKTSETPSSLVAQAEKPTLSPNPYGSGFTSQQIVNSLPSQENAVLKRLYLVPVYNEDGETVRGYTAWTYTLEKGYVRVYTPAVPELKAEDGVREQQAKVQTPPRPAPEKIFNGEVVFNEEPTIKGRKLTDYIDYEGGVTHQELDQAVEELTEDINKKQDILNTTSAPDGSAAKLIGFNADGELISADIPQGITVDNVLDSTKQNVAVSGPAVAGYTYSKDETDALLEDKANVNGNYQTLTSGLADNLTPYSEDSGAEQDNPFISNGIGTNNNTEIVTVGDYGLLQEKQGNSVVINQLRSDATKSGTGSSSSSYGQFGNSSAPLVYGHKYLVSLDLKLLDDNIDIAGFYVKLGNAGYNEYSFGIDNATTSFKTFIGIKDLTNISGDVNPTNICFGKKGNPDKLSIEWKNFIVIDLTQMFNGDIPQDLLDHPEHFSWYYNGSLAYNTGTLVNGNGVKLVSTGRNLWNEHTELGSYSFETGNPTSSSSNLRSDTDEPIRVIPNTDYYIKTPNQVHVMQYDKDLNFLGYVSIINQTFKTPANCVFIKFVIASGYGTTYNHDITISLYYSPEQGGEGYDKYYAYEEPHITNTGTEVLRSAGSVRDSKLPSGEITRNVGNIKLNSLSWDYESANSRFVASVSGMIAKTNNLDVFCPMYIASLSPIGSRTTDKTICGYSDGKVYVLDSAYTDATTFKNHFTDDDYLYFQLATPTTEQGTAFPENLPINDYGMLYWLDSSDNLVGVPQGCKIFYPVNYKGLLDDINARTDGDASKIALESEITDTALNERGYYKQVDLSDQITDIAGLTYDIKKLYKCGNVVTLSIRAFNNTGSTLIVNTQFFSLPNGCYSTYNMTFNGYIGDGAGTISLMGNSGVVISQSQLEDGKSIQVFVSFIV